MFIAMSNLDQNHRRRQGMLFAAAAVGIGMLIVAFVSGGAARAEAAADAAIAATSDERALDDASAYLAALENMQGDFLQLGPDGSVAEGKFYLRRPGRLRFEYQPPDNLLVVADGTWVAVKDSSSPAQRYPIASTPLSLFLAANVDLAKSARVLNVESQPGALLITLADRAGEAPGQITLVFDQPNMQLRQWVVTDAQGLQTTVALRNVQSGIRADNALFTLRDEQRPAIGGRQ